MSIIGAAILNRFETILPLQFIIENDAHFFRAYHIKIQISDVYTT